MLVGTRRKSLAAPALPEHELFSGCETPQRRRSLRKTHEEVLAALEQADKEDSLEAAKNAAPYETSGGIDPKFALDLHAKLLGKGVDIEEDTQDTRPRAPQPTKVLTNELDAASSSDDEDDDDDDESPNKASHHLAVVESLVGTAEVDLATQLKRKLAMEDEEDKLEVDEVGKLPTILHGGRHAPKPTAMLSTEIMNKLEEVEKPAEGFNDHLARMLDDLSESRATAKQRASTSVIEQDQQSFAMNQPASSQSDVLPAVSGPAADETIPKATPLQRLCTEAEIRDVFLQPQSQQQSGHCFQQSHQQLHQRPKNAIVSSSLRLASLSKNEIRKENDVLRAEIEALKVQISQIHGLRGHI